MQWALIKINIFDQGFTAICIYLLKLFLIAELSDDESEEEEVIILEQADAAGDKPKMAASKEEPKKLV